MIHFDQLFSKLSDLFELEKAESEPLTPEETQLLQDALLRSRQPWLEWSTKREKTQFKVDPVAQALEPTDILQLIFKHK